MKRKRFLVTGGCGFIGSHLVERLLLLGHNVTVVDNLSTGRIENLPPGTDLTVADVSAPDTARRAMRGIDGCFHLAAVASVARSNDEPIATNRVNLAGSLSVFHAAAERGIRIVYASSAAVYGASIEVPLSEVMQTRPLSVYGADKLAGEIHAAVVSHLRGVPTVSLRFFNVYGPRQNPSSPYSGVISIFSDRISRGQTLNVHGDGLQRRDFVYVDDVVSVLTAAMMEPRPGATICNICTGNGTSIRELAEVLGELDGEVPSLKFTPARPGDVRVSIGDPQRLVQLYGLVNPTPLREGLARLQGTVSAQRREQHGVHDNGRLSRPEKVTFRPG
jgi:UDP-glucose 4-epimerase